MVVIFECGFPLVLVGCTPVTAILLTIGVIFHVTVSIVMRLNTFLWAFVAVYPAIAVCGMR
jgi:hypothetical protein